MHTVCYNYKFFMARAIIRSTMKFDMQGKLFARLNVRSTRKLVKIKLMTCTDEKVKLGEEKLLLYTHTGRCNKWPVVSSPFGLNGAN